MKNSSLLILCILLCGCVTLNSVKRDLDKVNFNDGVNEKEALSIAKMSMINSNLDHDYQLWAANVYDNNAGYWRIVFLSLHFNRYACVLIIEKSTGEILAFFEAVDVEESALGANPVYSVEDWKKLKKFY